ncbi:unnamed protein product (macronuclear) [Paramecium tetraurelia]|uniref:PI3K/PI4K catalytic domain-containing protein n=1 Tax=Paramecium tetraurelia TaxID=5888 RepID=A0CIQ9_PARTE|nr:uncharacterized protein GSPATT00007811001 [Paramecium tetraurelia]CAK70676.1 unnamed protein product [Paramecium tetraurelia]|eukprot:XP_001438073.1 hypothetical protein (macronuclear) [Paramecium tetraurelia strain d4-2]
MKPAIFVTSQIRQLFAKRQGAGSLWNPNSWYQEQKNYAPIPKQLIKSKIKACKVKFGDITLLNSEVKSKRQHLKSMTYKLIRINSHQLQCKTNDIVRIHFTFQQLSQLFVRSSIELVRIHRYQISYLWRKFFGLQERLKDKSPFQALKSQKLVYMIIKTGDNLTQEQFTSQLICQFDQFLRRKVCLQNQDFMKFNQGADFGMIEMIKNATTIDSLQKNLQKKFAQFIDFSDFLDHFRNNIQQALQIYVQSLTAYSLVCYFLQVKDRNDGNILLDDEGHLIHIDFGFVLSIPGKVMKFEGKVPFKILSDYITVLGRALFQEYILLRIECLLKILKIKYYYWQNDVHRTWNHIACSRKVKLLQKNQKIDLTQEWLLMLNYLFMSRVESQTGIIFVYLRYDKFQYFVQGIFY